MAKKKPSKSVKATVPAKSRGRLFAILTALTLLLLYACACWMKVHAAKSGDKFDPADDTAYYWTEAAVQYRYAKMVADGVPIPSRDVKLQHPEGVQTFHALTVVMEYVAGYVHRLLGGLVTDVPFHLFLIWLTALYSTLSIFPAYFLGRIAFGNRLAGLIGALCYGLSTPSAGRLVGGYGREDFALPFLFGGFTFLAAALGKKDSESNQKHLWLAAASGVLFAIGLSSWHFSRFFFLMTTICLTVVFLFSKVDKTRLGQVTGIIFTICAIACMTVPVLRAKLFILSPAMALFLAVVLATLLETHTALFHKFNEKPILLSLQAGRIFRWLLCVAPLLFLSMVLQTEGEGYGHVWALLAAKIQFLGVKPMDPSALDWAARVLWVEAFNSPALYYVLISFWAVIPASIVSLHLILRARAGQTDDDKPEDGGLLMLVLAALSFGLLFLLIQRISVIAVFFLAVLGGGCLTGLKQRTRLVATLCLLPAFALLTHEFYNLQTTTPFRATVRKVIGYQTPVAVHNWQINDNQAVAWIQKNTSPDAVFLSRFGTGPMVLAYTDRAISLQPKFEAAGIRDKVKEFYEALYTTEENLARFCEKYGVTHYLFDIRSAIDDTPDSDRYVADALKLATASPAYKMQFAPEKLSRFKLVYVNSFYRIYELVDIVKDNDPRQFVYQPFFDISRYGGQTGTEQYFDDAYTKSLVMALDKAVELFKHGRDLFQAERHRQAIPYFDKALTINPTLAGAHTYLGVSLAFEALRSKNMELMNKALREVTMEANFQPEMPKALYNLGYVRYLAGQHEGALKAWKALKKLAPDYSGLDENIAKLEEFLATRQGQKMQPQGDMATP